MFYLEDGHDMKDDSFKVIM